MTVEQRELRDAIRNLIKPDMSADEVADCIAGEFFAVEDLWIEHDVSTYGSPSQKIQTERWLTARLHRETVVVEKPYPNRRAGLEGDSPQP
jgi:hypothetical protein